MVANAHAVKDAVPMPLVWGQNCGLIEGFRIVPSPEPFMAIKIRTEADRKATPRPPVPNGVTLTVGRGQKRSLERGAHTRSKKRPGKRPHQG